MADITLNSAVRSNLRTLQSTTDLMNRTETRLSTGKKVNSALDNPASFFTAQSLDRRASDLGNLLDTVATSVKTLEAADNGISAIVKLVEQMKSTARSAQQSPSGIEARASFESGVIVGATAANILGGVASTGTAQVGTAQVGTAQVGTAQVGTAQVGTAQVGTAQVGTAQVGTAQIGSPASATTLNGAAGAFGTYTGGDIAIDGATVTIANDSDLAAVQLAIDNVLGAGYTVGSNAGQITLSKADGTDITITSLDSGLLDTIGFAAGNRTSANGTEASSDYQPASSNYQPASSNYQPASSDYQPASSNYQPASSDYQPASSNYQPASSDYQPASSNYQPASPDFQAAVPGLTGTLTVAVGSATARTVTFGTGTGEVDTIDELNAALKDTGARASLSSDGKLTIETVNQNEADSLSIGGSLVSTDGTPAAGQVFDFASPAAATKQAVIGDSDRRTNYKDDYNDLLSQISQLANDASFNGVNLLNGDDLKVVFNENGRSALDVDGVEVLQTLGLTAIADADFLDSSSIDEVIGKLGKALDDLNSQSSKFGSQLSIVQTRQSFTKDMIGTLEDGALALTGADTNAEAANLATLQTRQALIVSSLAISTSQEQNVLQLLR